MAAHTSEQRAFIVSQLAAYVTPATIVAEFSVRWKDTACTVEDVAACEYKHLDDAWKAYFDEAREAFLAAPTAEKRVRIAELHRLYVRERDRGAKCEHLLEQIAKEEAGFYGGKGGPGSGPAGGEPVVAITRTIIRPAAE